MTPKNKLNLLMQERGMTQRAAAKELGISAELMNKKVNGTMPFRWREVLKLCRVLGVDNPIGIFPEK